MALLLPANLMDADGVIGRMVVDIDEADWEDVQILGWMYQYYNAEVKDAFFASKAKETPDTIGPATQLFTPDWIVVSVNLFFTSFAKQARRSRKGGFTGCANVFSPIPVTA